jgi:hypothetical protein
MIFLRIIMNNIKLSPLKIMLFSLFMASSFAFCNDKPTPEEIQKDQQLQEVAYNPYDYDQIEYDDIQERQLERQRLEAAIEKAKEER